MEDIKPEFTQRIQQLYAECKRRYETGGKAVLLQNQRMLVDRLAQQKKISLAQLAGYHTLFDDLENLSFIEMVAYRAQVTKRTVYNVLSTPPGQLDEWRTIAAILQAAGVDQQVLWELNLLYLFERGNVPKKTRATTHRMPAVRVDGPATEPLAPSRSLPEPPPPQRRGTF